VISTFRCPTARRLGAALTGVLTLAACADAPSATAPGGGGGPRAAPAPAYARTGAPAVHVGALTRDVPLAAPITVQGRITPGGGVIEIPRAGLRLVFPAGLVTRPTTFWATARAGSLVAYEFGPSAVFEQPVMMTQVLRGTSLWKVRDAAELAGAYFLGGESLNETAESAFVTEFAPTTLDVKGNKLTVAVPHFSGWMVSTGRRDEVREEGRDDAGR
jgi:hypothetical protein